MMIRDVLKHVPKGMEFIEDADLNELNECVREIAEFKGEINRKKLGHWISRNAGRIVGGLRFEKAEGNTSAEKWMVKSV